MKWTKEKPTEPGWYWYRDDFYGPAPVLLTWTGFINRPDERELSFDVGCGVEEDWPDGNAQSFDFECVWAGPIPTPEETE